MVPVMSTWRQRKTTPADFASGRGTAVAYGNTAYFSFDNNIYSLTVSDNKWTRLPPCPYQQFTMAVIDRTLTTIGGSINQDISSTNILLSFAFIVNLSTGFLGNWKKVLPPMPTNRVAAAAVTTATHLVVAGGHEPTLLTGQNMDVVEVLDIKLLQWFTANSLPEVVAYPQITICEETIYLTDHSTVFSCSVEDLLKSTSTKNDSVWTTHIAGIPIGYNTFLVTVREHVLAIGGCDGALGDHPTAAIHSYDRVTNSWSAVGELPTPLWNVLAAVLPNNTVIVVGGYGEKKLKANSTYISP